MNVLVSVFIRCGHLIIWLIWRQQRSAGGQLNQLEIEHRDIDDQTRSIVDGILFSYNTISDITVKVVTVWLSAKTPSNGSIMVLI